MELQFPDRLETYFRLVSAALPAADGMAATDTDGELIWHSGAECDAEVVARICKQFAAAEGGDALAGSGIDGGAHAYGLAVRDVQGDVIGGLVLRGAFDPRDTHQGELALLALSFIGQALSDEQTMAMELDTMAEELTARYEELNLAYEKDDAEKTQFREAQETLRALVADSAEYLDSAMALLYVPMHRIFVRHVPPRRKVGNRHEVVTELESNVYEWIRENDRGLVVNALDEPAHKAACPGLHGKLAAVPLRSSKKEVIGLVACVRFALGRDYTNSDRNLLDVLSRKVTKIIDANYDELTGLVRREGLEHYIRLAIHEAQEKNLQHSLLQIDLSQLHVINDLISYETGDNLIREVSAIIGKHIRDTDVVSRIDGGTFAVLLSNCPSPQGQKIAQEMLDDISQIVIEQKNNRLEVAASVGIQQLDSDTPSAEQAMSGAEVACKTAKERGRNVVSVYSQEDTELLARQEHMRILGAVQSALRTNGFELFSQTIRPTDPDNPHMHFEILVRMRTADGELIPPGLFLPAAERYQLMPAIDRWVVRNTLATLEKYWDDLKDMDVSFAVNLSGQSIHGGEIIEFLADTFKDFKIPTKMINIEITETVAVGDLTRARAIIDGIRNLGCPVSLDDFGTGQATFSYLKQLPVDILKIDGVFIANVLEDEVSKVMVESINHVSHAMGLKTIAEYVETTEIEDWLRSVGVDYAQGYGVAKPIPVEQQLNELIGK